VALCLVERPPVLVVAADDRRQHENTLERGGEREGRPDLPQLVADQVDVAFDSHPASRLDHASRLVDVKAQQPTRRVVILGRVNPHARLAQPMPLARSRSVLVRRVDGVGLPPG